MAKKKKLKKLKKRFLRPKSFQVENILQEKIC